MGGLDYHSFVTNLFVWRKLRIEKVLRLPLPACNRILPYMQSFWNNNNGGSDAISKLLANSPVLFASVGKVQTVAFGRLLQLFAILLHHEYHAAIRKLFIFYLYIIDLIRVPFIHQ